MGQVKWERERYIEVCVRTPHPHMEAVDKDSVLLK